MDAHLRNILLNSQVHGTPMLDYYEDVGGYGTKKGAKKAVRTKAKKRAAKKKEEKKKVTIKKSKSKASGSKTSKKPKVKSVKGGKAKSSKAKKSVSANPWISYVKKYAKKHGLTYGESLKKAGPSYRKNH